MCAALAASQADADHRLADSRPMGSRSTGNGPDVGYRPLERSDISTIVRAFDDMWGNWGPTAGHPESALLSRHFVLHYLEHATRGDVAVDGDGRFLGVTIARVTGQPVLFRDVTAELERVDAELRTTPLGAAGLRETLHWHDLEHAMAHDVGIDTGAQAELCLFLVAGAARGRGVGGTLWRRLLAHFAGSGVTRYYLHTDSSCDVGFYRHKGLACIAERYAKDHPEDNVFGDAPMDDIFIYAGDLPANGPAGDPPARADLPTRADLPAHAAHTDLPARGRIAGGTWLLYTSPSPRDPPLPRMP
ncbi:GNAT family N-acetyltransferase, partial [Bifidobacterium sp. DSM 109958]